ncbi:MAG: response regulator [Bacteroidetes bacterium]|nr:response regulator [Bacteroidota bacterium]
MNIIPEILIVDDAPNAAKDFGDLIEAKYRFAVITTDNPAEALEIVKRYAIKVVVLDQRMPNKKGTDLYREIQNINPLVKALMFSGEADRQEVSDAYLSGFLSFLEKSQIALLPEKVFELYTRYEIDFARQHQVANFPIILSDEVSFLRKFFSTQHTVNFHFLSIEKINDNFIFDNKWITTVEVNAGQNLEFEDTFTYEEAIILNEDFEQKIKSGFAFSSKKLDLLKIGINTEINKKLSLSTSTSKILTKKRKTTYTLPAQPSDLNSNYIVKRIFEYAPVYMEFRGVLCKSCTFCGSYQLIQIIFYKQTKKISSRQTNIMKDQKKEIIDTGITQYF